MTEENRGRSSSTKWRPDQERSRACQSLRFRFRLSFGRVCTNIPAGGYRFANTILALAKSVVSSIHLPSMSCVCSGMEHGATAKTSASCSFRLIRVFNIQERPMSRNGITGRSNFVNSLSSPAIASRSPSSCVSFGLDSGGVRKSVQGGLCIPAPKLPPDLALCEKHSPL